MNIWLDLSYIIILMGRFMESTVEAGHSFEIFCIHIIIFHFGQKYICNFPQLTKYLQHLLKCLLRPNFFFENVLKAIVSFNKIKKTIFLWNIFSIQVFNAQHQSQLCTYIFSNLRSRRK